MPILLGQGIPLFGKLKKDVGLRRNKTREYASGQVQSRYEVVY
ncbi:MAG TPA: hypothetical protein VEC06_08935 [Paucimonas sp.]|nr:hypothetical protein [Paucimonas sp.]